MSTAIARSLPFAFFAACLGLMAAGCSDKPKFDFYGKWEGQRNLKLPGVDQYTANTLGHVTLTIKNDGHFELTEAGLPTAGDASISLDKAELTTKTFMGQTLDHQGADAEKMHPTIVLTPRKDGSIQLNDPMAVDHEPVVLTRPPSK